MRYNEKKSLEIREAVRGSGLDLFNITIQTFTSSVWTAGAITKN
jgi:hypothetical protein